jgi:citrate synthase
MSDVRSGLEGIVAFATEIAEPDREGGALRYRGVDIEDLVGKAPFEQVGGLLVDGTLEPGLPPAEPLRRSPSASCSAGAARRTRPPRGDRRLGRLIRPSAVYVGPPTRPLPV